MQHSRATNTPTPAKLDAASEQPIRSRDQRIAYGKTFREAVPRESHASWKPSDSRLDPIGCPERIQSGSACPIWFRCDPAGCCLQSLYFVCAAQPGLWHAHPAQTPIDRFTSPSLRRLPFVEFVGLFATPERNSIFDINDFDETLPAPWEWDVKRLAVWLRFSDSAAI
jgi:hypothetical protein